MIRATGKFRRAGLFAIIVGGSVAGSLDILCAIALSMYHGGTPTRLCQTIASGLVGTSAYQGGLGTASLGLLLHFLWSFLFAAVFWFASLCYPILATRPVPSGIGYGLAVYALMNFVVLPLSNYPHPFSYAPLDTSVVLFANVFLFGLPIALASSKALEIVSRPPRE